MTISRIGSKIGFTLVEVLLAVVILSFGMAGVVRGFLVMTDGIEASRFTMEASYLLKHKIADIEKEVIENSSIASGTSRGGFGDEYPKSGWEEEAGEINIDTGASKEKPKEELREWPKESLSKVRLSVMSPGGPQAARSLSLYTYIGYYQK